MLKGFENQVKIIVDGFGGDNAPLEVLKGCASAVSEYGVELIITGKEETIKQVAAKNDISLKGIEILNAEQQLSMEDTPRDIIKTKANSSMAVGLSALAHGNGDAFVSAGNTGALVFGSSYIVKCIKGIKRAALAPILPSDTGCYMLLDAGANLECRPQMLQQFGIMGSIYMEKILHISKPRVGLVNIGSEPTKGGELQKLAYGLLKETNLNFYGNVEARDIPYGVCDVVVADGFSGNLILKLTEGLGLTFAGYLKALFMRNILTKFAAIIVKSGIRDFKKKMDYTEYGGAPLMGIQKPVIKAHGSSNAKAFKNAIRQAIAFVSEKVIDEIEESLPKDVETES
jgi:glycerol-3-phosphate acyltransferase PlsX